MGERVETSGGWVEGVRDGEMCIFRGIPFAKPPVGPLRFRAPEPAEPWNGVRDASAFGPAAPQAPVGLDGIPGMEVGEKREDCLTLNVFTPAVDAGRRPVMVWIHGGAFINGSSSQRIYDFRKLAGRGDLVIVSINYRLGALGFLHLAGLDAGLDTASNAGILDQIAALGWVRDNIAAFGGDPGRVTIFGESAGGMSVGTLLGAPAARGLFHGAIAQSGAAHRFTDAEAATRVARTLQGELGVEPGQLARLWELPAEAIVEAQGRCSARLEVPLCLRPFGPVVDGATLPAPPIEAIRGGLSREVPVLVGATRDEEKLFGLMDRRAWSLDEVGLLGRIEKRVGTPARGLIEAYRKAREGRSSTEPPELYFAIETDRVYRMPAVRLAEAQSQHQPKTWAYLVTWESPLRDGTLGACHGIDVPFVLGAIGRKGANLFTGGGPEAERLSERMMDAWVAFARSGDPNHPGLPDWPPHDESRRATMLLGRECEVADAPLESEREAWQGIL